MTPSSSTLREATLTNGLKILAECTPDAPTAAVGFFVKAGTRDETPELMGVSHFLEHMMFKGTPRRTAEDVNREFDEIGANYNAYTSHENTVYYAQVLPEFLSRAVDLLGDMLRPSLREDDFAMEKKVILEEIGMYDDRPEWVLQDRLLEIYYSDHPLGFRVLGTPQTIQALTAEQMRSYFEHRYSPENIVVTAAGRVDFDALCAQLEELCGFWHPTGAQRLYPTLPPARSLEETRCDARVNRHYMAMLCPGPSAQAQERYAARVLADVLGESEGSRLYWALVDPGLADEADFSFSPQDQTGCFMAFLTCDPQRYQQVEAILSDTLNALISGREPITEAEVQRAKNKLATAATLQGERPMGRMQALGTQWLYQGQIIPLEEELQRLEAVTPQDLQSLLERWPLGPWTRSRLRPA